MRRAVQDAGGDDLAEPALIVRQVPALRANV
jgi:hypothetical protein